MKKLLEAIKDLIYDSMDYILMLGIIIGVIAIIGWRLDILFAKDAAAILPNKNIVVENNKKDDIKLDDNNDNQEPDDNSQPTNPVEPQESKEITVEIPSGSTSAKIGTILENHGLISSKSDFLDKAIALKLDTKLKSGVYTIETNSSIEEILILLTK